MDKLFQAALEREPQARCAFLDAACGDDPSLRREVEAMLASDEQAGSFIAAPAMEAAAQLMAADQSASMSGKVVGPYRIISQLGAGGMGAVYLAADTRLGRKVALKLLPDDFTRDQARLHRFHQEARAASALNHPNIITIFDIGLVQSIHYIATEYIEGETLREAMSRELTVNQSLDIAIQVASALAAAHQAGIIHRDIKPENLMRREDGYVKVLDFGLAKLTEKPTLTSDIATVSKVSTNPGTVMGTVSYMSPEQARGREVDARTDIFSLGVVLYEMITGRLPFAGETPSDVIAAILGKPPRSLARFTPDAPAELQRIISKALCKEIEDRYQLTREMLNDLKELKQELEHQARLERSASSGTRTAASVKTSREQQTVGTAGGLATPTADTAIARTTSSAEYIVTQIQGHKTGALLALITLMITAIAAFALYQFFGRIQPSAHFQYTKITRILGTGIVPDASGVDISPQGRYVAYSRISDKGNSLWVRQIASNSDIQVVPPVYGIFIASTFSHDENFIYYILTDAKDWNNQTCALYRVPTIGGTPVKLLPNFWGAIALSPDDKQMAYGRGGSLMIANADGSNERKLVEGKGADLFAYGGVSWSPDGKLIASGFGPKGRTVVTVSVSDGKVNQFTSGNWMNDRGGVGRVAWLPDGSGILFIAATGQLDHQIMSLSYPGGVARRVTNDTGDYDLNSLGVTADGSTIVATQLNGAVNVWVTSPADKAGRTRQITVGKWDAFYGLTWTPDGRIVYDTVTGDTANLWVTNADGTGQKQLTSEPRDAGAPFATADGRYMVFNKTLDDKYTHAFRMDADGSNQQPLIKVEQGVWSNVRGVSPDNKWALVGTPRGLWRVSIDGGEPQFLTDRSADWRESISPDGKMFVSRYHDKEVSPPRYRVAIFSTEDGKLIKVFDPPPNTFMAYGGQLAWMPDGRGIAHVEIHDNVFNLWNYPLDGGPPQQLTHFIEKAEPIRVFAFSPDGSQIALSRSPTTGDVVLIKDLKTAASDKN